LQFIQHTFLTFARHRYP